MTAPLEFVVVGASLAGLNAARAALQHPSAPRVTVIGAEEHLPYDRPPLSKAVLKSDEHERPPLFGSAELAEHEGCTVILGATATGVDTTRHVVALGEREVRYDALVIATGATPRTLPLETPPGVHTLRTWDDAVAIRSQMRAGGRMVVIGAGFIGSEVAASAKERGMDVVIVEALEVPLARAVGETAGAALGSIHARHGVDLRLGRGVVGFEGEDRVTAVTLSDGSTVPADLVVVGIGAVPQTGWLAGSGIDLDNGIVCDSHLRTSAPEVFAAGDVARWDNPLFERHMRIEHWTSAQEQGGHAAHNALDPSSATPYSHVPYFWSDWYDSRIQFVGVPSGTPEIVDGSWDAEAFTAIYREEERVVGALTLNRRADIMKYRVLIEASKTVEDARALARDRAEIRARKAGARA